MDEAYSYGLMNYDKLNITDNSDFFNQWHTKEYYLNYLEIEKEEAKDFSPVYENQKNDVHPPLYYLLLRISASFSIEHFTKWSGLILNLVIFSFSTILVYFIGKQLFRNPFYALLGCFVNGCVLIGLESFLYIRMYELANLCVLLLTYWHLKQYHKNKITIKEGFFFGIILLLGGLTHYYFFLVALVQASIYTYYCIKHKKKECMLSYWISIILSAGVYFAIFPYAIEHILAGERGLSHMKTKGQIFFSLVGYLWLSNKGFFYYLLPFLFLLVGILCYSKKERRSLQICPKSYFLLFPAVAYFIVIVITAPFIELRYLMPIYSVSVLGMIYLVKSFLKKGWNAKNTMFLTILLFLALLQSSCFLKVQPELTYTKYHSIAQKVKQLDQPIIFVFNVDNNRFLDDIYLFTLSEKSILLNATDLTKIEEVLKEQEDSFLLMCNEGVNEENLKFLLKDKKIEYLQRMNAANLYRVIIE